MKKVLLLLTVMLVSFVSSAQITYDGDIKVWKGTAVYDVAFDYSALKINNQPSDEFLQAQDEDFRNDWKNVIVPGSEAMGMLVPSQVNDKFTWGTNPQYKFVIKVTNITLGNAGQMFNPFSSVKAGGAVISGDIDIIDVASGEIVAVLHIDHLQGYPAYSDKDRWIMAYAELAKRTKKILKKAK